MAGAPGGLKDGGRRHVVKYCIKTKNAGEWRGAGKSEEAGAGVTAALATTLFDYYGRHRCRLDGSFPSDRMRLPN